MKIISSMIVLGLIIITSLSWYKQAVTPLADYTFIPPKQESTPRLVSREYAPPAYVQVVSDVLVGC